MVLQTVGLLVFSSFTSLSAAQSTGPASLSLRSSPAQDFISQGKKLREGGHCEDAIARFRRAAQLAQSANDTADQATALHGESGCFIRLFRYREALDTAEQAYKLANSLNNDVRAGAIAINKATVYFSLGDYASARSAAAQAVSHLERTADKTLLPKALVDVGSADLQLARKQAGIDEVRRAVSVARSSGNLEEEADAEDYLGEQLMLVGDLVGSQDALLRAQQLQQQLHNDDLLVTQAQLADLRFHQQRYPEALHYLDKVLASSKFDSAIPRYVTMQLKGRCLAALGQPQAALTAFSEAVHSADFWRRDVLPGDATGTNTVVSLSEVYLDYVNQAAQISLLTHNAALARRALDVLMSNRAANLRNEILAGLGREMLLPPRYYELLHRLSDAQARVTLGRDPKTKQTDEQQLQQIRLQLTDLENQVGSQDRSLSSTATPPSLTRVQSRLHSDELLLSFSLAEHQTYLWAVTNSEVALFALLGADDLSAKAQAFSKAIQRDRATATQGTDLSNALFGQLPSQLLEKHNWLIVADGTLLDGFPFSALPAPNANRPNSSLIATRTVRLLPSEALLRASEPAGLGLRTFVGVADPIYNLADPRLHGGVSLVPARNGGDTGLNLGRLVGSEREVKASAAATGVPQVHILTGLNASVAHIQQMLAIHPQVVHFAVHVVSPESSNPDTRSEAALALSLTSDNMPELMTKETIARLRVPGSLVVLSGCASQQGVVLPSAGMVGLSRAWLLAGASAVLVTAWPTPDESGHFFESFYSQLRAIPGSIGPRAAAALEKAQFEMRSSSGYRSNPSFWAAYSLIAKE